MTINLSQHGMYVFAATNLALGTEIEVAFRPSSKENVVHANGIVRRKAVYLYGIEFPDNDDVDTAIERADIHYGSS